MNDFESELGFVGFANSWIRIPAALPNLGPGELNRLPVGKVYAPFEIVIDHCLPRRFPAVLSIFLDGDNIEPVYSKEFASQPEIPYSISLGDERLVTVGVHRLDFRFTPRLLEAKRGEVHYTLNLGSTRFSIDFYSPYEAVSSPGLMIDVQGLTNAYLNENDGLRYTLKSPSFARSEDSTVIYAGGGALGPAPFPIETIGYEGALEGTIPKSKLVDFKAKGSIIPLFLVSTSYAGGSKVLDGVYLEVLEDLDIP